MKRGVLMSAVLLSLVASAVDFSLECPDRRGWTIDTAKSETGSVETLTVHLSSPTSAVPPRFAVSFDVPQLDAHHKWMPNFEQVTLPPNWG